MKQWLFEAVEYLKTHFATSMEGAFNFWTRGLIAFALISAVMWLVSVNRSRPVSIRALVSYLFPRKLYSDPTARISHWHYLFAFVLWAPLLALVAVDTFKFGLGLRGILADQLGPRTLMFDWEWSAILAQASALILSASFALYWIHYGMHKVPFLWSFHRPHHSAEALTLPAFTRAHPVELFLVTTPVTAFAGLVVGLVLYVTGAEKVHPTVIAIAAAYGGWEVIIGIFEHAHVPLSFGSLNRVLYAPVLHQIHHSAEARHRDKNLGNLFRLAIWDWMFGTLYLPEKGERYRWGLNDREYGPNNPHLTLREFYLEPFRHAWSVLRRPPARRAEG